MPTKGIQVYVYTYGQGLSVDLKFEKENVISCSSSEHWRTYKHEVGWNGKVQFIAKKDGRKVYERSLDIGNWTGDIDAQSLADISKSPQFGDGYCLSFGLYYAGRGIGDMTNKHQLYICLTERQEKWQEHLFDQYKKKNGDLGELYLQNLFLPGSHDAGMFLGMPAKISNFANTQYNDIKTQLKLGARYFDFRPGTISVDNAKIINNFSKAKGFWGRIKAAYEVVGKIAFGNVLEKFRANEPQHIHAVIPGCTYRTFLQDILDFLSENTQEIVVVELVSSGIEDEFVRIPSPEQLDELLRSLDHKGIVPVDHSVLEREKEHSIETLIKNHQRLVIVNRIKQHNYQIDALGTYSDGAYQSLKSQNVINAISSKINHVPKTKVTANKLVYLALQLTAIGTSEGMQMGAEGSNIFTSPLRSTKAATDRLTYDFLSNDFLNYHDNERLFIAGNDFYENAFTSVAMRVNQLKLGLADNFSPSKPNHLASGSRLNRGDYITSPNEHFKLIFQQDGNLVLYNRLNVPVWATGTHGKGGTYVEMQADDGNLVIYDSGRNPKWASHAQVNNYRFTAKAYLELDNSGTLVIYQPRGDKMWSSRPIPDRHSINRKLHQGKWGNYYNAISTFKKDGRTFTVFASGYKNSKGKYPWFIGELNGDAWTIHGSGEWARPYEAILTFSENGKTYLFGQSSCYESKGYRYFISELVMKDGKMTEGKELVSGHWNHFYGATVGFEYQGENYVYGQSESSKLWYISKISSRGISGSYVQDTHDHYYGMLTMFMEDGQPYVFALSAEEVDGKNPWFISPLCPNNTAKEKTGQGKWNNMYTVRSFSTSRGTFLFGQKALGDNMWFISWLDKTGAYLGRSIMYGYWDNFYPWIAMIPSSNGTHLFRQNVDKGWFISEQIDDMMKEFA